MTTYSPTWTRSSIGSYNEQKAYTGLIGGTNSYLMEDEFNEMQWLMTQQHAKKFAMTFSSGSFSKGSDSVSSGTLTIAPRDLLVAGHYIRMQGKTANSGNNVVALPTAPVSGTRQDLVYLVLSFVAVTPASTLYTYGNQQGDTLTNDMQDSRIGADTQHRVQKQWSIQTASGQTTLTALGYTATTYDPNLYTTSTTGTIDGLQYAIPLYIADRTSGSPDTLTDASYYLFNTQKGARTDINQTFGGIQTFGTMVANAFYSGTAAFNMVPTAGGSFTMSNAANNKALFQVKDSDNSAHSLHNTIDDGLTGKSIWADLATFNGGLTVPSGETATFNGPVGGSTVGSANGLATLDAGGHLVQSAQSLIEGTTNAGRTSIPNYDQYLSNPDANNIYTTLQLKRPSGGTLYMQSVLSNPDANSNYQTDTWTFYATDGTTVTATHVWSLTWDANKNCTQKVMTS